MDTGLTFAIPFHRGLEHLRTAVDSVLAQKLESFRLLVYDDGAVEPGARELVESFRDRRIHYRCGEHVGMVGNWNRCLDEVATPLVTLLHADDRLLPSYAERVLDLSQRHPGAVAYYCGAAIIDAQGRRRFSLADRIKAYFSPPAATAEGAIVLRGEPALRALMAGNFIMCPTLCFDRERLAGRRFSERWKQVQDLELTSRLLMESESIVGTGEIAYEYRRHPASATARQSESFLRFDEELALFDEVADRAELLGWQEAARVARSRRIVVLHLLYRSLMQALRLRPDRAVRTLRYLARAPRAGGGK